MISESKWIQYGEKGLEVKGICVHNTGVQKSARELFAYLNDGCKTSQSCHFLVDHLEVIQVMPLDWCVWHTGKGYDFGNLHTIAIEICSNHDLNLYKLGQDRAIELINSLKARFNLDNSNIYFHNDFSDVNCPSQILSIYGTKINFIEKEIL